MPQDNRSHETRTPHSGVTEIKPRSPVEDAKRRLRETSRPTPKPASKSSGGTVQDIGKLAAANPMVTGSIVLAAITLIGPFRTIRWAMRGIAMVSLAAKLAEGATAAKLDDGGAASASGRDPFGGEGFDVE